MPKNAGSCVPFEKRKMSVTSVEAIPTRQYDLPARVTSDIIPERRINVPDHDDEHAWAAAGAGHADCIVKAKLKALPTEAI